MRLTEDVGHTLLDSRGFSTDLAMVPLFAVGEVFLVGAFELLHGANVGPEREQRGRGRSESFVLFSLLSAVTVVPD